MDFGNTALVPCSGIKELPSDLLSLPFQVILELKLLVRKLMYSCVFELNKQSHPKPLSLLSGSGVPSYRNASFSPVHNPGKSVEQPSPQPFHHTGKRSFSHCVAVLHPAWCHASAVVHQRGNIQHQYCRHTGGRRTCCEG